MFCLLNLVAIELAPRKNNKHVNDMSIQRTLINRVAQHYNR